MSVSPAWLGALLIPCLALSSVVRAQDGDENEWPREITTNKGTIVIYQPQPEDLTGNKLTGRTAIALELTGQEQVFGAMWFKATLNTDRAERTATIADFTVTQVRFPEQDETKAKQLSDFLAKEVPSWDMTIQLDRLLTTLAFLGKRDEQRLKIKVDPPVVLFEFEPAILITIDGEPRMKKEEGAELDRVINTPFTILYDRTYKKHYLYADKDTWYAAATIQGDWEVTKVVPQEVADRAPKPDPEQEEEDSEAAEEDKNEPGPPPKIIVATKPTELIVSNGKPEMAPIEGTELLYLSNSDSDVAFEISSQRYYILLSGRWYYSTKTDGPWENIASDDLPEDFAKIPKDHQLGTVLYAVPETEVAKEAVLDAHIPQTATVDRKKATLQVEYDGEPKFEPIEGTRLTYAVNTATPVIYCSGRYYACDEAVWFVGEGPKGPWKVATVVPSEIYTIPPECPVYNVTYVHIYDTTPEVVYVGYTQGYTGTYVYGGTIVYGTGYYYRPWYGRYYYARPCTWGFCVRWNPWHGWAFGFSYGWGPFRFSVGVGRWWRGGWWGPARHRGYRHGYRHGYRRGARAGYRAGYRAGQRSGTRDNIYRSQRNQARTRAQPRGQNPRPATGAGPGASRRPNNVYADRQGNVHRKTDNGWQDRQNNSWKNSQNQRNQQQRTQQQQQLNRSSQNRQRGAQRSQSYNRSRSSGGGGRRGGGGGRR